MGANEKNERYYVQDTVYDVKELRLTGVAVQLPGERETWMVFHHFLWTTDPGFYGTEAIQIRPACRSIPEGWAAAGDATGRVLYDRGGQTFAAPYASLGARTFTAVLPRADEYRPFAAFPCCGMGSIAAAMSPTPPQRRATAISSAAECIIPTSRAGCSTPS
ncbi:MAG: hypothetical protein ACLTG4_07590 [Oscillospiraceae bacterium]